MPQPSVSLTLYGEKAEFFREIQGELADEQGFEPSNADVAARLMAAYNRNER